MSSAVIRVEQATPALIGWYEPELVDRTYYLRPQSLKGVWRWFARALVAGALYELGYLSGKPGRDTYRVPREQEINVISELVGKDMGLGYAGGGRGEGEASKFLLRVDAEKPPCVGTTRGSVTFRTKLQRVVLLSMARGGRRRTLEYFYDGSFQIEVALRGTVDQDARSLALRALLLALNLSGLGKGSRRGLGSFDITGVSGLTIERDLERFMRTTYEVARKFVEDRREKVEKIINKKVDGQVAGLPPLPAISSKAYNNVPVFRLYRVNANWVDVHNFFLRSERCRRLVGNYKGQDTLRAKLEAWILGLPREQKGTGYVVEFGEITRRASPILVAVHTEKHVFGPGVYVSVFASADWPSRLKWKGRLKRKGGSVVNISVNDGEVIIVDDEAIVRALEDALNELWDYLKLSPHPSPVWP